MCHLYERSGDNSIYYVFNVNGVEEIYGETDFMYDYKTIRKQVKKAYFDSLKRHEKYSRTFVFELENGTVLKYEDGFNVETQEYFLLQDYLLANYEKSLVEINNKHVVDHNYKMEVEYYDIAESKLPELDKTCQDIRIAYAKKQDTEPLFDKLVVQTLECAIYYHISTLLFNYRKD